MSCIYSHLTIFLTLFFFNDTATTEIYTLSLHDALPIYLSTTTSGCAVQAQWRNVGRPERMQVRSEPLERSVARSEEHTSELQSQSNLVCRLLLEKKKKNS